MKNQTQLDNQWIQILQAGTHDGETYTPADLDGMVREYKNRPDNEKTALKLGLPSANKPEAIGTVDALRRAGNAIEAKVTGVDPRVERLYGRGVFPKKSVQVKRSPDGVSLQHVGLIHPVYRDYWRDDETPGLDDLMKQATGAKDHVFQESPLSTQWLELFRAGDYGDKGHFTDSDLDQVVRNFNPSFHEPPAVIGHPKDDAPAYAWVDGLKRNGNILLGKFRQIDPQFEEMVRSARFKKRSVSFYRTANGPMLRHVGFLGAQPPEVKGLANASFGEDSIRFVTVSFDESESRADTAISHLKREGYWHPEFDRGGLSILFNELERSPALDILATFLEKWQDECGIDPGSARLSRRAQQYASYHSVSFGEALQRVQQQREQNTTSAGMVSVQVRGSRLSQVAENIARARGVSFGEALSYAAEENPELTIL